MAASDYDSESSLEEIVGNDGEGGIQPYQFAPAAREEVPEETEEADDPDPFTQPIDFPIRVGNIDWCKCDACTTHGNPLMNFCCQELEELQDRIFADDLDCICLHQDFDMVVLHPTILRTALVAMKDVKRASLVEPIKER